LQFAIDTEPRHVTRVLDTLRERLELLASEAVPLSGFLPDGTGETLMLSRITAGALDDGALDPAPGWAPVVDIPWKSWRAPERSEKALSRLLRALKGAVRAATHLTPRSSSPAGPLICITASTGLQRRHNRSSAVIRSVVARSRIGEPGPWYIANATCQKC